MTAMSVSQAQTWETCPLQWWMRYEAKAATPVTEAGARRRGIALHAGIEAAYRLAAESEPGRDDTMVMFGDDALDAFEKVWPEAGTADRFEAMGLLLDVLDSLPRPRPERILAIEKKFRFEIDGVVVTGVMDLVLDCGDGWIHIRDWKSGSTSGAERSRQLAVYWAAARILWPEATRITVGLYSLKDRREDVAEISSTEVDHHLDALAWQVREIERGRRAPVAPIEAFPPSAGEHCVRCPFRAYCPEWGAQVPLPGMSRENVAATRDALIKRLNGENSPE